MLACRVRMATSKDGIPKGYVLATDDDFSGTYNGDFKYIGSDLKIVIPKRIKGVAVTSYNWMFDSDAGRLVEGVASNNTNVTSMRYMFYNSAATTLDLSYFDTSNVTDMQGMFMSSAATELDLSNFDTSNVTNMNSMFSGNLFMRVFDLSSFDTSNVTDMSNMFFGNPFAHTGYARTQADANRLNATSNKPSGLTFVVKP